MMLRWGCQVVGRGGGGGKPGGKHSTLYYVVCFTFTGQALAHALSLAMNNYEIFIEYMQQHLWNVI